MTSEDHFEPIYKLSATSLAEEGPADNLDPVQRLSSELVSRIFEYHSSGHYPSSYEGSPMVLGYVCHAWRDIAWSTPSLWDVVTFALNPDTSQPLHNIVERTKRFEEWVGRSGALPISIYVCVHDQYAYELDDEDIMPLIKIINGCFSRWYHLELELPATVWSALGPIKSSNTSPTTLRSFWLAPAKVFLEDEDRDPVGDLPQCFIPALPSLRSLQLYFVNFDPRTVKSAWDCLTNFLVGGWSLEACMEVIHHAPLLRSVEVTVRPVSNDGIRRARFSHTVLGALKNLKFVCLQDVDCNIFFDTLTVSALQSLALEGAQIAARSVINMLDRSQTQENVKHFSLTNSSWTTEEACSLLTKLTTLESLTLDRSRATVPSAPNDIFQTIFARQSMLKFISYCDAWPEMGGWKFLEHLPMDERSQRLGYLSVSLSTSDTTCRVRILERSTLEVVQQFCKGGSRIILSAGVRHLTHFDVLKASIERYQKAEHP